MAERTSFGFHALYVTMSGRFIKTRRLPSPRHGFTLSPKSKGTGGLHVPQAHGSIMPARQEEAGNAVLGNRLTAGQLTLDQPIVVRIHVPQPT